MSSHDLVLPKSVVLPPICAFHFSTSDTLRYAPIADRDYYEAGYEEWSTDIDQKYSNGDILMFSNRTSRDLLYGRRIYGAADLGQIFGTELTACAGWWWERGAKSAAAAVISSQACKYFTSRSAEAFLNDISRIVAIAAYHFALYGTDDRHQFFNVYYVGISVSVMPRIPVSHRPYEPADFSVGVDAVPDIRQCNLDRFPDFQIPDRQ